MDPVTLGLIGAGVGLGKGYLVDAPREARQRQEAAVTAQWSPWTGMSPRQIQSADPFGSAMQAGITGAILGQKMQKGGAAAKDTKEAEDLTGGAGTSPTGPYMTEEEYQPIQPIQPMGLPQPTWMVMGPKRS